MLLFMTNLKIKFINLKFEIEYVKLMLIIYWNDKNTRAFCLLVVY